MLPTTSSPSPRALHVPSPVARRRRHLSCCTDCPFIGSLLACRNVQFRQHFRLRCISIAATAADTRPTGNIHPSLAPAYRRRFQSAAACPCPPPPQQPQWQPPPSAPHPVGPSRNHLPPPSPDASFCSVGAFAASAIAQQAPTTSTTRPQRTNQLRIATTAGTLAAAPMAPPGLSSSRWPPRGAHKGESTADAKIGGRPMLLTRTVPATTAEALQGGLRGAGETLRMLSPPRVPEPRWLWKTCVCVWRCWRTGRTLRIDNNGPPSRRSARPRQHPRPHEVSVSPPGPRPARRGKRGPKTPARAPAIGRPPLAASSSRPRT